MPGEPSQEDVLQAVYGHDRKEREMEELVQVVMQQTYASNMPGEVASFPQREAEELIRRGIATPRSAPPETAAPDAPPTDKMIRGRSRKHE